jgi:hypothetical protein
LNSPFATILIAVRTIAGQGVQSVFVVGCLPWVLYDLKQATQNLFDAVNVFFTPQP